MGIGLKVMYRTGGLQIRQIMLQITPLQAAPASSVLTMGSSVFKYGRSFYLKHDFEARDPRVSMRFSRPQNMYVLEFNHGCTFIRGFPIVLNHTPKIILDVMNWADVRNVATQFPVVEENLVSTNEIEGVNVILLGRSVAMPRLIHPVSISNTVILQLSHWSIGSRYVNYFHFVNNMMTQLSMLMVSLPKLVTEEIHIVLSTISDATYSPQFVFQWLHILGIPSSRVLFGPVQSQHCLWMTQNDPITSSLEGMVALRSILVKNLNLTTPSACVKLVQRNDAQRQIINIDDVVATLRILTPQVSVVRLEELDVAAQLRGVSSCSLVVGVHGAAFANIAASFEGSGLLEIVPRGFGLKNIHFWHTSHALGLRYFATSVSRMGPPGLTVNVAKLERLIRVHVMPWWNRLLNTTASY